MGKVIVWTRGKTSRNTTWERAIANGLRSRGYECLVTDWRGRDWGFRAVDGCDFQVCWGVGHKAYLTLADKVSNTLVMEMPYFGVRSAKVMKSARNIRRQHISLAWGGLNGRGDFCGSNRPDLRLLKNGPPLRPYRDHQVDDVVLIAGQVEADFSHCNLVQIHSWYRKVAHWVRCQTDLPIVFRNHPKAKGTVSVDDWGVPGCSVSDTPSVADDLQRCRHVVVFNSNFAVDAVLHGVPTLAWDRGCMAYDLNSLEIGVAPSEEERYQWACNLAYCQWKFGELWRGVFWDVLGSRVEALLNTSAELQKVHDELAGIKTALTELHSQKGREQW